MSLILTNILLILSPAERKKFWTLIVLNILISIADIAALAILLLIINFYIQPTPVSVLDRLPGWLADHHSIALILVFLLGFSVKNIIAYLVLKSQYRFTYQTAANLSEKNLTRYFEGDFPGHVYTDSSVYIRRIHQQPIEFSQHVLDGMQQIITQSALVLFTIIAILLFNAKLFLLLFLVLVPPVLLVSLLVKKRLRVVRTQTRTSGEKSIQHLTEALEGYVESNIYDRHDFFKERYSYYQRKLNTHLADLQIVQALPSRLIEIFAILGFVILIAISQWTGDHTIDIITTGAFIAAAYKIIPGIVKILNSIGQVKVYEFTINDLLPVTANNPAVEKQESIWSIEFNNISFSYKEKPVLKDLSFTMHRGDIIGLSGISGSGKTTTINLLLGFIEPTSGSILFNENNTSASSRKLFWKNIAYIKQQGFLLHDTILTNITLSSDPPDEERLKKVLHITGLDEWVKLFPEGIKKIVAESGKDISGGQRQRIALARALYKPANLIILDEPFNELDDIAEKKLLHYLKQLAAQGYLLILVTHNQESLTYCTKIIPVYGK